MSPRGPVVLSAALICRDEEANLPRWLASVSRVADEVVAVDSGSGDRTVELLRAAGARVERREWTGYSDQRNHCASLCRGRWVLMLDADEIIDDRLAAALAELKARPDRPEAAFLLSYKVFFFGRFLRWGGYFGERHLRLYRPEAARWERREVHERLTAEGPVGGLPGYVHHHSYRDVGEYLRRADTYSAEAARQMRAAGKIAGAWTVAGHAAWAFLHRYVLRMGFLDGYAGYLAARLESLYTLLKYARLRELATRREEPR